MHKAYGRFVLAVAAIVGGGLCAGLVLGRASAEALPGQLRSPGRVGAQAGPAAPTNLTATVRLRSQAVLTWTDNSADETGFQIDRSPTGTGGWVTVITTTANVTTAVDIGLDCSTTYFYQVEAYNAGGVSTPTVAISVTTPPCTGCEDLYEPDDTPAEANPLAVNTSPQTHTFSIANDVDWVKLAATAGRVYTFTTANQTVSTTAALEVYAPDGVTRLVSDTNSGGQGALIVWPAPASALYYLRAFQPGGGGGCGTPGYAYTLAAAAPLTAPTNLTATAKPGAQIALTWTDNSLDESGFAIERSPNALTWTQVATATANTTVYTDTGLNCSSVYLYRVRATSDLVASGYSNVVTATTLVCAPSALTATALSPTQVRLGWADNSPDESGFKLERSPNALTWTQVVTAAANTTAYTDTNLSCSTRYYYRLLAYNGLGGSDYTAVMSTTTWACAPSALTATAVSPAQVGLGWVDNSPDENGFGVERSPNALTWTPVVTTAANTTVYTDTNLASGTLYYYRVRAFSAAGPSDYSAVVSATTPAYRLYLPAVLKPSLLTVTGLETTQSSQTAANDVPLVTGRATVLRVYVQGGDIQPTDDVRVSVKATRGGVELPGSPLVIGPQTAPLLAARASYGTSFNTLLPAPWLSGQVVLTALAYVGSVPAPADDNNSAMLTVSFNDVPPLKVMVVPILYTHTPTGQVYPAPTVDDLSSWIMRAYPISAVNLAFHAPFAFVGDLRQGSAWDALLNAVSDLKTSENAPDAQIYYGLIPTANNSGSWFSGGISGYGWVGWRGSIGLDLGAHWGADAAGENAAHEMGHNLGRQHVLCKGNEAGVDTNYPYHLPAFANGSIGQLGLDINQADVSKSYLWSPDVGRDLMSYCNNQWVSDYTYKALYADQRTNGARVLSAEAAPGLLIRATFDAQGAPTLKPVYAFATGLTALPASSDYSVDLLDAAGQVLASYPVKVLEAEEESGRVRAIRAVVPQPAPAVASVRLVQAGRAVAQRRLSLSLTAQTAATPTVTQSAAGATMRWGASDIPALVRYTVDGGRTWTTLGVDVMQGELTFDPAQLPAGAGRFDITLADAATGQTLTINLGQP